jgi:creatinine amidohydrolase
MDSTDLYDLTWEDAEASLATADLVVLPTGSLEQHSRHLPLSVDTIRADELSAELVEAAPDHDLELLRLPTLPFGYSEHHMNYAGTVTLAADTYRDVIVQIGASMARHGASGLLLVNCHGGNIEPLKLAADRLERDHDLPVHFVHWTDYARDRLEAEFGEEWGHAGPHETSVIEHYRPDLVREDRIEPQERRASYETKVRRYFDDITRQGGLGDPTDSDPEFVAEVIEETTETILRAIANDVSEYE